MRKMLWFIYRPIHTCILKYRLIGFYIVFLFHQNLQVHVNACLFIIFYFIWYILNLTQMYILVGFIPILSVWSPYALFYDYHRFDRCRKDYFLVCTALKNTMKKRYISWLRSRQMAIHILFLFQFKIILLLTYSTNI